MTARAPLPAVLLVAVQLACQGRDPVPPPGGFPVVSRLDQLWVYADGYRTRYDLRYPDPAPVRPPASGWPVLVLVHGGGGSRKLLSGRAASLAGEGYFTIAYDVRGQGDARALNPGKGLDPRGSPRAGDLAEMLVRVPAAHPGLADPKRLGVLGGSQGGAHAWWAAAASGRPLPAPRGALSSFPTVRAVSASAAAGPVGINRGPVFGTRSILNVYQNRRIVYDPAYRRLILDAFYRQDFSAVPASPWRQTLRTWITRSAVPVLAAASYHDGRMDPAAWTLSLAALPPSTARLALFSTGHHGSPRNTFETAIHRQLERRWFDRFLKGRADELDRWRAWRLSVVPADAAAYGSPTSVWDLRVEPRFPPAPGAGQEVLYLRQGGLLSTLPPTAAEPPDTVRHQVARGFTPQAFLQTGGVPAKVFARIPLSTVRYRGPPAPAEREVCGRAVVELSLDTAARELQVHVVLGDEDRAGAVRWLADGWLARRDRKPGKERWRLELDPILTVQPQGHRFVLLVENHVYHRPGTQRALQNVPYFTSATFAILHDPAHSSSVSLPVRPRRPGFRVLAPTFSVAAGGTVPLRLTGGPARAGWTHLTLISLAGTQPGVRLGPVRVPLNPDAWTVLGLLLAGPPPFQGFVGVLDPQGQARPALVVPPRVLPAGFVGLHFSLTAVLYDRDGRPETTPFSEVYALP